jgi:transcriptional regulator GlxA family with amidase domain
MSRNGIQQQMQTDGQRLFGVLAGRKGRRAPNRESHVARKIEQSISYMLQHINQPLQVATLAAAVNVSPSHYSALFKRWMGCSPIDYFIHLRMRHACQLFDSTSLNVKEVAAALGYDDPFYFSRTFKSVNRVAPSEYRMMSKRQKDMVRNASLVSAAPGPEVNGEIHGETDRHEPGCEPATSRLKVIPPLAPVLKLWK